MAYYSNVIIIFSVKLLWKKTTGFDLDTNEKPDRVNFSVTCKTIVYYLFYNYVFSFKFKNFFLF